MPDCILSKRWPLKLYDLQTPSKTHTHTCVYIYISIYIDIYMCVCVCVCIYIYISEPYCIVLKIFSKQVPFSVI